jgi:hypothetical protein
MKTANRFDPTTGEYIGQGIVQDDPMNPGQVLMPGFSTMDPVPELQKHQAAVRNDGAWTVVPDWRGVPLWSTRTAVIDKIYELAQVLGDRTEIEPDCPFPKWNGNCWVTDAESEANFMKNGQIQEMENYLTSTDWYAVRFAETGKPIPPDIAQARQAARDRISELKA